MRLKVIGSSSKGNCYILENETEALIIECGVRIADIKRSLEFNIGKVVGCLLTHEHGDHAFSIKDILSSGLKVYSTPGTFKALNIKHHNAYPIEEKKIFKVGGFSVMAFDVKHDVAQPVGFLINHEETGNILFVTDTYYLPYTFKNLNQIIIEANYSFEIVRCRIESGSINEKVGDRVLTSHMSIDSCKEVLLANDLKQVQNIVLIHLSEGNSNAEQFHKEITSATGKKVHVADSGVIIENFNKYPF